MVPESVVEYIVCYFIYLLYVILKSVEPTEKQRGAGERGGVPGVVPPG